MGPICPQKGLRQDISIETVTRGHGETEKVRNGDTEKQGRGDIKTITDSPLPRFTASFFL